MPIVRTVSMDDARGKLLTQRAQPGSWILRATDFVDRRCNLELLVRASGSAVVHWPITVRSVSAYGAIRSSLHYFNADEPARLFASLDELIKFTIRKLNLDVEPKQFLY